MKFDRRRRIVEERIRSIGSYLREQQSAVRNVTVEQKGTQKGAVDIVTRVDRECERRIVEMLRSRFPRDGIRAEEGTRIESCSGKTWVVDPLDGTVNFIHGHPLYAVSVGLVEGEEIMEGYVFLPELSTMYRGRADGVSRRNGELIEVSRTDTPALSLLTTGAWEHDPEPRQFYRRAMARILPQVQGVLQNGCAALDLCLVAEGTLEGFWQLNISPWDYAGGVAIVRGAGGRATHFSGKPTGPRDGCLLASNGPMHGWLRTRIQDSR